MKSPFYGGGPADGAVINIPDEAREWRIPMPVYDAIAFDHQSEMPKAYPVIIHTYRLDKAGRFKYVGETTL